MPRIPQHVLSKYQAQVLTQRANDIALAQWGGWTAIGFTPDGCGLPMLVGTPPDTTEPTPIPRYAYSLRDCFALLDIAARWRPPVSLRPAGRGQWYAEIGPWEVTCTIEELPTQIYWLLLAAIGAYKP